jgi:predicted MFS family arabinose efflux permease
LSDQIIPKLQDNESSIHYQGWSVATAAFVGVMVSFAPIVPYTFSLFLNPLHAAFGWQREAISGTFALAAITVAVVSPGIGVLLDRFPPRRIILPSIVIFALALASLSRLGPSIQRFYLTYFVLGLVANGTAQFAYTRTILTWFNRRRGLAIALLLTGSGVGSILIPPLTQWVIDHHGWRNAYLMLGSIALLGLPLTALLLRNRAVPQRVDESQISGATVGSALRTAPFWILAFIIMLSAFGENGLVTNLAAMLTEHGVTVQAAALALSVRGGAGIVGRLFTGFPIDKLPARRIQTGIRCCSGRFWTSRGSISVETSDVLRSSCSPLASTVTTSETAPTCISIFTDATCATVATRFSMMACLRPGAVTVIR